MYALTFHQLEHPTNTSQNGIKPKQLLKLNETVEVASASSSSKYTVKRVIGHYYCNCPAWRVNKQALDQRTCKHLKQVLGDDYEAARIGPAAASGSGRAKRTPAAKTSTHQAGKTLPVSPLLAHSYDPDKSPDPTGWFLSEKLDGVRAIWTGTTFLSRQGNEFFAPPWFTRKLPKNIVLDGELFTKRGGFQECVSIVRTQGDDTAGRWKYSVSYRVFDIPTYKDKPFEKRLEEMKKLFDGLKGADGKRTPWIEVLPHTKCKGKEHLMEVLDELTAEGAEGVMLRQPGSKYEEGRSKTLLKVKKFLDCDAVIIGHTNGTGKNQGLCGALECEMLDGVGGKPNGVKFKVGSGLTDKQRRNPPKKGTVIIVKYQELSKSGNPRFPTYAGERAD